MLFIKKSNCQITLYAKTLFISISSENTNNKKGQNAGYPGQPMPYVYGSFQGTI